MAKRSKLDFEIVVSEVAFRSRLLTISCKNNICFLDPALFLQEICIIFPEIIQKVDHFPCKINRTLVGKFFITKGVENGDTENLEIKFITTKNKLYFENSNPNEWFNSNVYESILLKLSEFSERNSGWSLKEIISLEIKINKCMGFFSGGTYVELPKEILNIRNNANCCFAWALGCHFQNVTVNVNRVGSYRHFSEYLNFDGINFPMA